MWEGPQVEVGQVVWRHVKKLPAPFDVFGEGWLECVVHRLVECPRWLEPRHRRHIDQVVVLRDYTGSQHRTTVSALFGVSGFYEVVGASRGGR